MFSPRTPARSALALCAIVAVGCTDAGADDRAAPTVVQPGAPGEPSTVLDEVPEREPAEHTAADTAFMQGMIAHHVQALRMTRLVPDRTARDDIPLFAERMDVSQEAEIDLMRDWLADRGEDVPSLSADHDHGLGDGELMPGMLTEDELLTLEAAEGPAFDRLFLESMIRHHEGALAMVDRLFEDGGGQEPEIGQFAQHVQADQGIELGRMHAMLEDLDRD
jgi:uncharacterized protein (DUF305 family)